MAVRYFDGTEVKLGDVVETRFWLLFYRFRERGRVVYVPGVTPLHREFERDGLQWVGIRCEEDGTVIGEVIDPKVGTLLKRVRFLGRDSSDLPPYTLP